MFRVPKMKLTLISLMDIARFIKKKSYEKIELVLRRHVITFLAHVFLFALLMLAPVIFYFILKNLFPGIFEMEIIYIFLVLGTSIFYMTAYLLFFVHFLDYYLDLWIVTNDRIIDIEQFGLFSRTISELDLFRIQDVTSNVHGFFPTMLNYGNIHVKTASSNIDIVFRNVRDPNTIREQLIKLSDEDRKFHYKQDKDENQ